MILLKYRLAYFDGCLALFINVNRLLNARNPSVEGFVDTGLCAQHWL